MPRLQAVPYERVAALYRDAVELDLPPVKVIAEFTEAPYRITAKRIERLRLRGWLPPGQPENSKTWLAEVDRLTSCRLSERSERAQVAVDKARAREARQNKILARRRDEDIERRRRATERAARAEKRRQEELDRAARAALRAQETAQQVQGDNPPVLDLFLGAL